MTRRILAVALGAILMLSLASLAMAASTNGSAGDMPAFYDCRQFIINFKELPPDAEKTILAKGGQFNLIYMSDQCMTSFVSVLDAIQGDGFNPLWREVQVSFPGGCPTSQDMLCSDDDITTAAMNGTVMLNVTDELYRCSVVGPKK